MSETLVMLPGMDGSANLFKGLLEALPSSLNTLPISLPQRGPQNYQTLLEQVSSQLPVTPFFLLGESFSGPLAALVANEMPERVIGIIFAASFITPVNHPLAPFGPWLPIHRGLHLPGANIGLRRMLADERVNLPELKRAILGTPEQTLKLRMKVVSNFDLKLTTLQTPALYLGAKRDRLVGPTLQKQVGLKFHNLTTLWIDGPHMILQAAPEECAHAVSEFMTNV